MSTPSPSAPQEVPQWAKQYARVREEFEIVARAGGRACIDSAMLNVDALLTAATEEVERLRGKLGQLAVERDRLQEDLANAQASTIHTCHDNCQRVECRQRREIKELSARLTTAELALNEAREQWRMSSVCRELQGENERLKCMLNNAQREAAHLRQQLDDIGGPDEAIECLHAPLPPHMRDAMQSQEKAPDSKEGV